MAQGEDWPGVLGPNRNGTTIQLPMQPGKWQLETQPKWEIDLGSGYSGPAIVGGVVYAAHRQGDSEMLTAIDLLTGKKVWQTSWEASYTRGYDPDLGPRCVPCVGQGRVLCYGAGGDLICLDARNGAELWQRALRKEYKASDGYFGAGSSPLLIKDTVIVCVGGSKGGVVALDLKTGKTKWTATDYEASYASPIAFTVDSKTLLLVVTRLQTVLIDAASGDVLSEVDFGSRGPTVNAATPIALDDLNRKFLLTASYNIGTLVLSIEGMQLKEEYRERRNLMASQYNTPVRVGDIVFGTDGREDAGNGKLRAIDPSTREVFWEVPDFGTSHLIGFEKQLLALDLEGRLVLLAASSKEFEALAETRLPDSLYRSLPALSGRYLVVRANDRSSSSRLMMFELP